MKYENTLLWTAGTHSQKTRFTSFQSVYGCLFVHRHNVSPTFITNVFPNCLCRLPSWFFTITHVILRTVGVNKMFLYLSRTTRVVRWHGMRSMRDVRNHYAPHGTVVQCVSSVIRNIMFRILVSKQSRVNRSLPWLTWRQNVYVVLPFSRRISEHHEDQSLSNPRRTNNDMHNDRSQNTGRYWVEVIV